MTGTNQSVRYSPRFCKDFTSGTKDFAFALPVPPGFTVWGLNYDITATMLAAIDVKEKVPCDIMMGWYSPPNMQHADEDAEAAAGDIVSECKTRILESLPSSYYVITSGNEDTVEQQKNNPTEPFNDVLSPDYIKGLKELDKNGMRIVYRKRLVYQIASKKNYPIIANVDADYSLVDIATGGHWRDTGRLPKHKAHKFSIFWCIVSMDDNIGSAQNVEYTMPLASTDWLYSFMEEYDTAFENIEMFLRDHAQKDKHRQLFMPYDIPADLLPSRTVRYDFNFTGWLKDTRHSKDRRWKI